MLEIEQKRHIFKTKEIWFSESPFEIKGYDQVSFRACKNKVDLKGFKRTDFTTLTIDLTQSLDEIWHKMSYSSCRYSINRAVKSGVSVKINQGYEEFYEICYSFRETKGLPEYLGKKKESIDFMKKYGTLFISELNGEMLGGQFCLEDKENIRGLLAGSKRLEVDKKKATLIGNANRLVIWEAIKYAKNKELKEYDMGGYYTGEKKDEQKERINVFKKSFGGELATHYIYEKNYSIIYLCARKTYSLLLLLKRGLIQLQK